MTKVLGAAPRTKLPPMAPPPARLTDGETTETDLRRKLVASSSSHDQPSRPTGEPTLRYPEGEAERLGMQETGEESEQLRTSDVMQLAPNALRQLDVDSDPEVDSALDALEDETWVREKDEAVGAGDEDDEDDEAETQAISRSKIEAAREAPKVVINLPASELETDAELETKIAPIAIPPQPVVARIPQTQMSAQSPVPQHVQRTPMQYARLPQQPVPYAQPQRHQPYPVQQGPGYANYPGLVGNMQPTLQSGAHAPAMPHAPKFSTAPLAQRSSYPPPPPGYGVRPSFPPPPFGYGQAAPLRAPQLSPAMLQKREEPRPRRLLWVVYGLLLSVVSIFVIMSLRSSDEVVVPAAPSARVVKNPPREAQATTAAQEKVNDYSALALPRAEEPKDDKPGVDPSSLTMTKPKESKESAPPPAARKPEPIKARPLPPPAPAPRPNAQAKESAAAPAPRPIEESPKPAPPPRSEPTSNANKVLEDAL